MNTFCTNFLIKIWDSPLFTTWGGLLVRSSGLAVMMPLILIHFSEAEVALWYLFATLIGLQVLFQFGFVPTFVRCISYARGGATSIKEVSEKRSRIPLGENEPNRPLIHDILGVTKRVYAFILLGLLLFILAISPLLLSKPMEGLDDPNLGWIAWGLLACGNLSTVFGTQYATALQGMAQVPMFRRNEIVFSFIEIVCGVLILLTKADMVLLAVNQCFWRLLLALWLRRVAIQFLDRQKISWSAAKFSKGTFYDLWPATWRSGVGSMASTGSTQLSGVVYAQLDNPIGLGSYLIALRLVTFFSTFSMAPLYSPWIQLTSARG